MNQLALSNDLNIITAEINSYKQVAGQSLFEIGKRLKHVKENDLAHGQWMEWLGSIEMDHSTAQKFIRSYEQFGKLATSPSLNIVKVFEMLSLPESVDRQEFIEQPHIVPSTGEQKTVAEMTVKETREVAKAIKDAEAAEKRAQEAEAKYRLAVNQHSEQQDKLLEQIEELKKKKTLSLEEKQRIQNLTEENLKLNQSIQQIREEHDAKVSKLENDRHSVRKLRESFKNILISMNLEHSQAEYYFRDVGELKDAQEAVHQFLQQFESEVIPRIEHWRKVSNLTITEGEGGRKDAARTRASRTIIDADN